MQNQSLNKFFNKLYISFPNISNINETQNLINDVGIKNYKQIKYVYTNKDSTKWFAKSDNDNQEIFIFGKINNNTPQPHLLSLTFDKVLAYSDKCSAIINSKQVYIRTQYFINKYPNFKTKLEKQTIDILIDGNENTINVINLGDYEENFEKLLKNLDILLDELENYILLEKNETIQSQKENEFKTSMNNNNIQESKFSTLKQNKNESSCEICGKKLKKREKKICRKCSQKKHAAKILKKLLKYVNPETPFTRKDLKQIYLEEREINDCIWSLQDYNLIKQNNEE